MDIHHASTTSMSSRHTVSRRARVLSFLLRRPAAVPKRQKPSFFCRGVMCSLPFSLQAPCVAQNGWIPKIEHVQTTNIVRQTENVDTEHTKYRLHMSAFLRVSLALRHPSYVSAKQINHNAQAQSPMRDPVVHNTDARCTSCVSDLASNLAPHFAEGKV